MPAVKTKNTIALPPLKKSELYRGLLVSAAGKPLAHLIEIKLKVQNATWDKAREIASKAGGALPTRHEGALLRASQDLKLAGWFWLGEQHADGPDCAWYQYFSGGSQYWSLKSDELRVRAVRRVPI